jgi:hypothetical protein
MALRFKVKALELPVLVQLQPWNAIVLRIAWANSGKEKQIPYAASVWIKAHWFRGGGCFYFLSAHVGIFTTEIWRCMEVHRVKIPVAC